MRNVLVSLVKVVTCVLLALGATSMVHAQDKADATGTWKWTSPGRNGGTDRTNTLVLKVEGEKLTGTLSSPGRNGTVNEVKIEDGKVKGDEVSFTVVREFQGNKMTSKYSGKVTADTLKGKIQFDRNGETQSRDWEAKREKK